MLSEVALAKTSCAARCRSVGYRMIRGIHHVSLHTQNFERLAEFYRDAFGFLPAGEEMQLKDNPLFDQITGVRGGATRVLMMKAGNCFVELFEWTAPPGRKSAPLKPNDLGYTHFCVDVTDIDEEYRRLSALGMRFAHTSPVTIGQYRTVYGQDPDGNVIEIQQVPRHDQFDLEDLAPVSFDQPASKFR